MSIDVTFGSVASGIEAASVAFNPLGWRAVWLSEIERSPCELLAYHYPEVPNLGNMLLIPSMLRNGSIPAPDVFTGGTPCQAFSIAGLRKSLGDARGNLSLTFCEIADEIDIQRAANGLLPCVIKWENVPGVLATEDNAFGCFLAGLAGEDEALVPEPCPAAGKAGRHWKWNKKTGQHTLSWPKSGCVIGPQRAIAWRILDAQYFGVAQRRRRLFVVASARDGFDPASVLFEFDGVRRDTPPSREAREEVAGTVRASAARRGGVQDECGLGLQPVAAPVARSVERPRGDGLDTLIPTVDLIAGGQLARCLTTKTRIDAETETLIPTIGGVFSFAVPTLDASYGRLQGCAGQDANHGHGHLIPTIAFNARQDPDSWVERTGPLDTDGGTQAVSYAIQAGALRTNPNSGPDGVEIQEHVAYTLEARSEVQAICFSSKDHGADATTELAPTMRAMNHAESHANGGGQLAVCITGDITHTLKAEGFDASEDGAGRGQPIVAVDIQKESNGELVNGAREGAGDMSTRAMRDMREGECRSAPQERGLARPFSDESAATLPQLPPESAQVWQEMHAMRQPTQGVGVLRDALPALQEVGRSNDGEGQPVHESAQGLDFEPGHSMQNAGLPIEDAREGVLREARSTGQPGPHRENQHHQVGGDGTRMGHATSAVRRLTPRECERLQGFQDDYTLIPGKSKNINPAKLDQDYLKYLARGGVLTFEQCMNTSADGPRYKAIGNSWAVPNVRWIGRRIDAEIRRSA